MTVTAKEKDPIPERWHWADVDWNNSNAHAQILREHIAALERVAEVMIDTLAPDRVPVHELSLAVRTIRKPIINALRAAGYLGGGE